MIFDSEEDRVDAEVFKAVNDGDRTKLLQLEGQSALIGRCVARGDYQLIKACASHFKCTASRMWRPWLEFLDRQDLNWLYVAFVAEGILIDFEDAFDSPAAGSSRTLNRSEKLALDLEQLYESSRWQEWDVALLRGRMTMPWDPRLTIAEARGQRVRSRETALRLLKSAFSRYPDHFTIGQMLASELSWAVAAGLVTADELPEFWEPVERLLEIDPYDLRVLDAKEYLFPLSAGDVVATDQGSITASAVRDMLIREVRQTLV